MVVSAGDVGTAVFNGFTISGGNANSGKTLAGGTSSYSKIVSVASRCPVVEARLHPNPAGEQVIITRAGIGSRYKIYTGSGRMVKNGNILSDTHRIDLRDLPAGVYLVSVSGHDEVLRLVKE